MTQNKGDSLEQRAIKHHVEIPYCVLVHFFGHFWTNFSLFFSDTIKKTANLPTTLVFLWLSDKFFAFFSDIIKKTANLPTTLVFLWPSLIKYTAGQSRCGGGKTSELQINKPICNVLHGVIVGGHALEICDGYVRLH